MSLLNNNESSVAARLESARRKQWHQQGEALLTIENARSFLNAAGLVLFAPRPQIAAPAPSFVEAVLGETNAAPTIAQTAQAREMLARLVAEGLAVPLNLLGVGSIVGQPGDAPDFIASAQVFSYIFTLRGDKAWKQPPAASGAAKVTNLAVAAHEALTQRGPMTALDLVSDLGKEVTEAAVLRALGELWMHLRVLPLPQQDGRATLWELASTRLTKQIKAGANAGLPTALSTLISLYLGQAIVATEDEIESFLSPLSARSRVRDVLHALLSARQLETVAIEGRTVLHVAGEAPAFLSEETPHEVVTALPEPVGEFAAGSEEAGVTPSENESGAPEDSRGADSAEPGSRIAKFVPRRKPGAGELAKARPAKFAHKPLGEARKPFGEKRPFAPRDGKGRPAYRDGKSARPFGERRSFKPADRSGQAAGEGRPRFEKKRFAGKDAEFKPRFEKRDREGAKPERERRPFGRPAGGDQRDQRPPRPERKSFDRPSRERTERGDARTRKPFERTVERSANRKPFERTGERSASRKPFERTGERSASRKPFGRSNERRTDERSAGRKSFGGPDRFGPKRESSSGGGAGRREFKPKPFGRPKPFGERAESGDRANRRPGGFGGKKPFARPGGGSKPFGVKPRGEGPRPGGATGGAKFAGKKFGGAKSSGFKSGGSKFGGAKKPFGKPAGPRAVGKPKSRDDQEA